MSFWRGRRVLVTGHTGFKGSWLSLWLSALGAHVTGYALAPPTRPSMYRVANVGSVVDSWTGDVRNLEALRSVVAKADPEVIFHLAAQPLVHEGYRDPVLTMQTNIMGTVNLLEAARELPNLRALVNVTTDKVYENAETGEAFPETARLGGHDPYSASKAASEIVTSSYRSSFPELAGKVATARAGNVIGGGDWAPDRLVPDILAAHDRGEPLLLRHPEATRPWQHVLDPLAGYLRLAEALAANPSFAAPWNFGPRPEDARTVGEVADALGKLLSGRVERRSATPRVHEAVRLTLDSTKARERLGWTPKLGLDESLGWIAEWHRHHRAGGDVHALSLNQIHRYEQLHALLVPA